MLMEPEEGGLKSDRSIAQRLLSPRHGEALDILICPHPDNISKLVLFALFGMQRNWD